jgi:hypothetical protein
MEERNEEFVLVYDCELFCLGNLFTKKLQKDYGLINVSRETLGIIRKRNLINNANNEIKKPQKNLYVRMFFQLLLNFVYTNVLILLTLTKHV